MPAYQAEVLTSILDNTTGLHAAITSNSPGIVVLFLVYLRPSLFLNSLMREEHILAMYPHLSMHPPRYYCRLALLSTIRLTILQSFWTLAYRKTSTQQSRRM